MESITDWKEPTVNSLNEIYKSFVEALPNLLGAILILIIGWILIKLAVYLLKKVLILAKVDKLTEVIKENIVLGKADLNINVLNVIIGFVKWVLYLVLLIVAADIMKWNAVSLGISNLVEYIPTLFSALALFVIGLYIANLVKNAVNRLFDSFDLNGAKIISNTLFYIIAVIITVTALNQAGINTDLITNNLTIIFGAFLVTASLAFGLGSKEVIGNLLKSFYARKNFEIGQKIKFKNVNGTIESIDNISMILKTDNGKIVLPIADVVENQVEIEL